MFTWYSGFLQEKPNFEAVEKLLRDIWLFEIDYE